MPSTRHSEIKALNEMLHILTCLDLIRFRTYAHIGYVKLEEFVERNAPQE